MITNKGKDVIAKYLIGQTPAYASYIAVGCGVKPLNEGIDDLPDSSGQTNLELEMFRTQITSRGYITDSVYDDLTDSYVPVSKVVFTAEIPPEQRYLITEVGVFSAKSNPAAIDKDSRTVFSFTDSENWEYHDNDYSIGLGAVFYDPLYKDVNDGSINITPVPPAFRTNSDNAIFSGTPSFRKNRYEQGRYLDVVTFVPGNMSYLEKNLAGDIYPKVEDALGYYGQHIHLSGIALDLSKNSPEDELRLAFSVVNKPAIPASKIKKVRLVLEFSSDDTDASTNYARMQVELVNVPVDEETDIMDTNRYFVVKSSLQDLRKSAQFSWNAVRLAKIYASVFDNSDTSEDGVLSSDYYISLDSLRFENTSSTNPLYGLVGYSPLRTSDALPVVKNANSSNMIEFRFGLDVG